MSHLIRKSHNVSILVYHYVCPAKYRRAVLDEKVDQVLRDVCLEIAVRYQIEFLEIGTDKDHVHFLVQSIPTYSPTKIITMIKSLTAREIFARAPHVKKQLWGGEFWTDGYYVSTVGQHATEDVIKLYVKNQGQENQYARLHVQQLELF
ncbi:MAG: IS200/IS605 family transposase [Anaerolineae bacterium]|jgi:REP element-mobilizing transposase RayT|nr:IS200/IS605 family transposase [Anaerolineae bacterium]